MRKLKYITFALLTILLSVNFAACGNDNDDKDNGGSNDIVGLWKCEKTHDGGGENGYEFRKDGKGIYYDDWNDQGNVECFDYIYDASTGKLTMKWHADTTKENWDSPVTQTTSCTVTVLSNDRVRIVDSDGYTMFLVRQ